MLLVTTSLGETEGPLVTSGQTYAFGEGVAKAARIRHIAEQVETQAACLRFVRMTGLLPAERRASPALPLK